MEGESPTLTLHFLNVVACKKSEQLTDFLIIADLRILESDWSESVKLRISFLWSFNDKNSHCRPNSEKENQALSHSTSHETCQNSKNIKCMDIKKMFEQKERQQTKQTLFHRVLPATAIHL